MTSKSSSDGTPMTPEAEEFQWVVGQSLTPKQYKHLGKVWDTGKTWMANADLRRPDGTIAMSAAGIVVEKKEQKVGGEKRQGLAKEEDLIQPKGKLSARLFGKAIPKK